MQRRIMRAALLVAFSQLCAASLVDSDRSVQRDDALLQLDRKEDDMQRIINGAVVEDSVEKYSFFAMPVSASNQKSWLGCGASIISPTAAISAAHCYGGGHNACSEHQKLSLMLGEMTLADGEVQRKGSGKHFLIPEVHRTCHTNFDGKCSHGHDIVLLRFDKQLPSWVEPVILNLTHKPEHDQDRSVTAIGFGDTEGSAPDEVGDISPLLREATLTMQSMSADACQKVFLGGWGCSDEASEAAGTNVEQQVCAWSDDLKDTCAGDSGSALLDHRTGSQIGITSYGGGPGVVTKGPGRSCGDKNFPGLYSRVSSFKDFICEHVKDLPAASKSQCAEHASSHVTSLQKIRDHGSVRREK
mmetsp:Transcript_14970/g.26219  ORF Transcript_14970/g.26219 Transcript_14970/m.26219 type:complete len:358 (+) Transcript_14970:47-1120(+)